MKDVRCPECGFRLKTNQCPICLTRVPFPGLRKNAAEETQPRQMWDEKPKKQFHIPVDMGKMRRTAKTKRKPATMAVVGVILALLSLISSALESCDGTESYSGYDYDAYVAAGVGEAADVPEIESRCVYDANGLTITVDGLGLYYGDYTIPLTVVNNSRQDVTMRSQELSVNGYMLPGASLWVDVESGDEAQSLLILNDYDLQDIGITEVAEVAFWLDIYDGEEYTDIAKTELITLQTSAKDVIQPVDDNGYEIYNDDDLRIVIQNVEVDNYGDCILTIFAQNDSAMTVTLEGENTLLNGYTVNGFLWATLRPGTRIVDRIYLDEVDSLGIETNEDLETLALDLYISFAEGKSPPREILKTNEETFALDLQEIMANIPTKEYE